ncbi:hypothetical protein [Carboxylicivirga sp. M1479]|uniref:hypothetical protein n=1 Tax=Carboxylicivirga sp. M1479 TaxID=2594476 RepID=UPI0011777A8B|nr:hypothetical protein [Carboxylicivirga sp. M1479]TRX70754.1 hypothetical protein FNN09_09690 [Carboxylicivirga sp. M1479]
MSSQLRFLILWLFIILTACKKDPLEEVNPKSIDLRLSTVTSYVYNTPQQKTEFIYEDQLLVQALEFELVDNEWLQSALTIVDYTNVNIGLTYEYLLNGQWIKSSYLELYLKNDLLMERKVFCQNETDWIEEGKYVYSYRDGRLIDEVYSPIINGEYQLEYKTMCFYKEDRLFEIRDYEIQQVILWVCNRIFAFNTIDADHIEIIESVKNNLDEWDPIKSYQLRFENGRISEYTTPEGSINFMYDEYGNLIQESNSAGEQIIYSYETGKGNAALLYMNPFVNQMGFPSIKSTQANANIRSLIEMKTHE